MNTLTRRQLAEYAAEQLRAGRTDVVREVAAYLLDTKRTREVDLVVRDIESALARRGAVVGHVSSARPLDEATRTSVRRLLERSFAANSVHLQETVEPELIGGIKVSAADHELDGTTRRALQQLRAVKV